MRPRHWWVAAVGAGVLASGAFVAPAALAAPAPTAAVVAVKPDPKAKPAAKTPARPVVKKGRVAAKHRPGAKPAKPPVKPGHPPVKPGRPGNHHHHPHYPPHATPSVNLTVPAHAHIGRKTTVTAKVSINTTPVAGALAGLYGSIDGGNTWKKYTETKTGADGSVTFSYTPQHNVTLRVVVAGGAGYAASQSPALPLNVKR